MKWDVKSLTGLADKAAELISTADTVLDKVQELKTTGGQLIDKIQSLKADDSSNVSGIVPAAGTPDKAAVAKNAATTEVDVAVAEVAVTDIKISNIGSTVMLASSSEVMLALETVNKITEEVGATIRYCEEQHTRREEIAQSANVRITQINRMTELIKEYLDKTFDERGQLFDSYFSVLDRAMTDGDVELMSQTLAAINSLAVSSPFKDLADIGNVAKSLSEGSEWDI